MIIDSKETKQLILDKFLEICPFEGWNDETLTKAIDICNIDKQFLPLIFENGCLDLAKFFIESQNNIASLKIDKIDNFHSKKIRDKIRLALYARFEVEKNNQIALQRLANFYINPKNLTSFNFGLRPIAYSLKSCYEIADFIWFKINDQSTDFNFYTKRATLSKIIMRSFLVFVKDESNNFEKTKNFIDLEIEKVMKFEKIKAKVKNFSNEAFFNKNNELKSPKDFVKNLPFIRLFKF